MKTKTKKLKKNNKKIHNTIYENKNKKIKK